jgi:hypothetical protein
VQLGLTAYMRWSENWSVHVLDCRRQAHCCHCCACVCAAVRDKVFLEHIFSSTAILSYILFWMIFYNICHVF